MSNILADSLKILKRKGISQKMVSNRLSIDVSYLSRMANDKDPLTEKFKKQFNDEFGDIAPLLLDNQKEFDNEEKKDSFIKLRQSLKDSHYEVYETDSRAAAGAIELVNAEPNMIFDPIKYGELQDVVGTIKVSGNSMYPTLPNGCNIAVKRLLNIQLLSPDKIYVLVDANNSIFVKRLRYTEKHVVLKSDNKTKEEDGERQYPDFERKWNDVLAIYEVRGIINLL